VLDLRVLKSQFALRVFFSVAVLSTAAVTGGPGVCRPLWWNHHARCGNKWQTVHMAVDCRLVI